MTSKTIRKMIALAGISVVAASANALPIDAKIMIDRALNSPTLTVRYEGAHAALVELRVNGESLGTRPVAVAKSQGETNFTLNLSELKDGDNEVEIRLFDRTGKLVGSDKTNISTDQSNSGPVFLRTPKLGQSVQGTVDIQVGFGRELKNVYVSFFVDSNFKKMTNYPPYGMTWDTTGETNGWHEIEAWAIDESSSTYKTRKTRVFINNPGGNTSRIGVNTDPAVSRNPKGANEVVGTEPSLRDLKLGGKGLPAGAVTGGAVPSSLSVGGKTKANPVKAIELGGMSSMKPAPVASGAPASVRNMVPNIPVVTEPATTVKASVAAKATKTAAPDKGTIVVTNHTQRQIPTLGHVATASRVMITKGQRIPNLSSFAVVLNSQFVDFDVNPRVDEGVPMAPFRHLIEKAGGTVDWTNASKTVDAKADGQKISLKMGDKNALVNNLKVNMERAPYIDRGRAIIPLSFLHDALNVDVEYDKETGHVLITTAKN